jgi:transcriptional regulator with XRE-family HTH domain
MTSWYFSPKALSLPQLPPEIRRRAQMLSRRPSPDAGSARLVAVFSSELIHGTVGPPDFGATSSTRYLVVKDVPDAVSLGIVSALDLRRPERRVHLTSDVVAVRRMVVASARPDPVLSLVDAFVWNGSLTVVTGDLELRSFPMARVPLVGELPPEEQGSFEVDADGSYLWWPGRDLHLGVSQILQRSDPMHLADVAIERNGKDLTGAAVRYLRVQKGLRQSDIGGLSERQVRRIEDGISRLTGATAEKFAAASGLDVSTFLDEVARRAGTIRKESTTAAGSQRRVRTERRKQRLGR